jgi:hypothetical protein
MPTYYKSLINEAFFCFKGSMTSNLSTIFLDVNDQFLSLFGLPVPVVF